MLNVPFLLTPSRITEPPPDIPSVRLPFLKEELVKVPPSLPLDLRIVSKSPLWKSKIVSVPSPGL